MKEFFKYTLATIAGLAIVGGTTMLMGFFMMCSLIASGDSEQVSITSHSVLVINLDGEIVEHATDNPFSQLMNEGESAQGLDNIVGAIDKAANNSDIDGIYIEAGTMSTDIASLQEIRNALVKFKEAKGADGKKKWITAYSSNYSQGAYYVCSVADNIWINPQGMVDIHGICAQPMFLKDMLAKVGVKMSVVKVGKFKSATEQFTEDKMSDANREQVTRYAGNLWTVMRDGIGKSRNISSADMDSITDALPAMQSTEWCLKKHLIDKTMYADEVKGEIKKLLKLDEDDKINQVDCATVNASDDNSLNGDDKIAIYYCSGNITQTSDVNSLMGGEDGIVSEKMTKDLDDLADDDDIKAVVIRVNSGGGDAFASEEIWHSVVELKKKKPVVISMGGMAASGAYYLSAGASWIVAQPTTLTGSIGIFGMFPDMSGLLTEKLGVKFDEVKTNKHSDFSVLQTARPFNAEEQAMLQAYINRGYELFCKRVADGRHMKIDQVKAIAQGHVYTGSDAISLKLVDELGGTSVALKKAAALAKLKDYTTVAYPAEEDWMTEFMSATTHGNNLDDQLRITLGAYYEPFVLVRTLEHQNPIQARCPFIIKNN